VQPVVALSLRCRWHYPYRIVACEAGAIALQLSVPAAHQHPEVVGTMGDEQQQSTPNLGYRQRHNDMGR
jgi:hypothetical protein